MSFSQSMSTPVIENIFFSPEAGAPMIELTEAELAERFGFIGDRSQRSDDIILTTQD